MPDPRLPAISVFNFTLLIAQDLLEKLWGWLTNMSLLLESLNQGGMTVFLNLWTTSNM